MAMLTTKDAETAYLYQVWRSKSTYFDAYTTNSMVERSDRAARHISTAAKCLPILIASAWSTSGWCPARRSCAPRRRWPAHQLQRKVGPRPGIAITKALITAPR